LEKRPVMVWIHGGGFYVGSGDSSIHGPDYIVEKDVVLVTLNYRLGCLGILLQIDLIRNKLLLMFNAHIICLFPTIMNI